MSSVKVKLLYLQYHKNYGHKTYEGGDITPFLKFS